MQVFVPYPEPIKVAECLDRRRLHKQIIECGQILAAINGASKAWAADSYSGYSFGIDTKGAIDIGIVFKEGANWRIDSVWHDTHEKPEENRVVLVITKASTCFICGPNNLTWTGNVRDFRITKWAYVDDLVPAEDEQ